MKMKWTKIIVYDVVNTILMFLVLVIMIYGWLYFYEPYMDALKVWEEKMDALKPWEAQGLVAGVGSNHNKYLVIINTALGLGVIYLVHRWSSSLKILDELDKRKGDLNAANAPAS